MPQKIRFAFAKSKSTNEDKFFTQFYSFLHTVAHQLTLERLCWIPTGGPNIITLILKQGRETQKDENQRNGTVRKTDWSLSALSDDEKGASSLGNSCGCGLVCPTLAAPWTVTWQAPLSMGFSRQEYWSGLQTEQWGQPLDAGKSSSHSLQKGMRPCSHPDFTLRRLILDFSLPEL